MSKERGNGSGAFGRGLVLGAILGAGLGVLFAPSRGSETRARILKATEGLRERARAAAGDAMERRSDMGQLAREASNIIYLARERTGELAVVARERGQELGVAAMAAAEELRLRGKDVAQTAMETIRRAISEGKQESARRAAELEEQLHKARQEQ